MSRFALRIQTFVISGSPANVLRGVPLLQSVPWPRFLFAPLVAATLSAQSAQVAQQFEKLHFRSIGPAIMSGRIADFAVYEKNTSIWYVGTAHGGV